MRKFLQDNKEIFFTTFVIGLIAHGFCWSNIFYGHDAAALWWNSDIVGAAGGARFLQPILEWLLYSVRMPWIDGILTLLFYSFAIWCTCESLQIKQKILRCLIAGLFITSPTAISSNHYTGYIFAFALMASCMAVYVYDSIKWGRVLSFILIFITSGVYASYVNVTIVLFLLYSLRRIIINKERYFLRQMGMAFIAVFAMILVLFLSIKITEINEVSPQERVETATEISTGDYIDLIRNAVDEVFDFFSLEGNVSFFQGVPIVYFSFLILFISSIAGLLYLLFTTETYKDLFRLIIVIIDIICLPIAMNMISIVTTSHYLMKFSFIAPWILAILILDMILEFNSIKEMFDKAYRIITMLSCFITIIEGIILANISYTKQYSNYEAGIQYANRVVSRIEGIEGYEPGETKVIFVGFGINNYSVQDQGYRIVKDLTGIPSDNALTHSLSFVYYIQQRIVADMHIVNGEDYHFGIEDCITHFKELNVLCDIEEILNLGIYPQNDCYVWIGDILVFKLGDVSYYDISKNDKVVMECWEEQGDYELTDTIQYKLDLTSGTSRIVMDVTNSDNFALEILDSVDVQDVVISKLSETQIYIDVTCKQNTTIIFQVGRLSQDEYTTIHRIAIRMVYNYL